MAAKFVVLALLVAAAQGYGHGGSLSSFSYGVSDPHTGDVKSQHETRIGDSVVGQYALNDADGTRRTVDYAADAHNGFNAVVRKDPLYHAAPVAVAAQVGHGYAAPVATYSTAVNHGYGWGAPLAGAYGYGGLGAYGNGGLGAYGNGGLGAYGYGGLGGYGGYGGYGAHGGRWW